MADEVYDVCIVGGGLAGSVLAYSLSPQLEVCVIERRGLEDVGRKPCGEAVHRTWFEREGVEPHPAEFDGIASRSRSIELHLPGERMRANLPAKREILILNRGRFIRNVLGSALDRGCDLYTAVAEPVLGDGEVTKVMAEGEGIKAGRFVDTSGAPAVLRRRLLPGRSDEFFRRYREIVDAEMDGSSAFWAFPRDGTTNVGGAVFRGDVDLPRGVREVRGRLGISEAGIVDSGFGPIPSSKPMELVHENVVAIGDAGLTANPLTGGGIGPTVRAANLLGDTIRGNEDLRGFQRRYEEEVAGGYEGNYWLSRLLLILQRFVWRRVDRWIFKKLYGGGPLQG